MTMRKLDILWKKHLEIKYPKKEKGKSNRKGLVSSAKRSIDEVPFL